MKLEEMETQSKNLTEIWMKEREILNQNKNINEKIETMKMKAAKAQVFFTSSLPLSTPSLFSSLS